MDSILISRFSWNLMLEVKLPKTSQTAVVRFRNKQDVFGFVLPVDSNFVKIYYKLPG